MIQSFALTKTARLFLLIFNNFFKIRSLRNAFTTRSLRVQSLMTVHFKQKKPQWNVAA
jgi:hypothetical protein